MYKVAVLASTNGTNFQSLLDAKKSGILKDSVQICCLVTNKECGAVEKAISAGIPYHIVDQKGESREDFDKKVMAVLDEYQPDLLVLGGYMRIISNGMVDKYRNRIINIHPSLLPKFGGGMSMDVHRAVIEAGETETGMTIHLIDEGVDTGPIVLQKSCSVDPSDTPETLKDKVQALEKEWYPKVVQLFADGKIKVKDNHVVIHE
ncbi:phosphoribosylglycinamide formyltransferase [Candidatus Peregrinibacteria bacterium]|nr:phosphoribosylglycinamide formyltransferase [Candidatus Peregrinibacteria bacterium]